jgi:hypothetical protein
MEETWILIDPNTGLHVGWYFWLRVLDEVNRSVRYGAPFGLLLLEAVAPPSASQRKLNEAASGVPAAIRSTDLGGVIAPGRVGVLLTQQGVETADVAKERILERLASSAPKGVRWAPRLLCYPEDGAEISNLLTSGGSERNGTGDPLPDERLA